MKINYPLIFKMTGCHDCECTIMGEDVYDCHCFLNGRGIEVNNYKIIEYIPEDCPARQHENIDVNLILNNIVKKIKDKFKCKVRWEYYPEDNGQYFIKVSDKKIYESQRFQSYIWDIIEQNGDKINLNYCYEK